ncbi:MAG: MBL fold metallo-hydrolase RNA specificity domain-containing protein [Sedimenticolaceae bacterium]
MDNSVITAPLCVNAETLSLSRDGADPFDLPGLHVTRETSESMAINQVDGGAVIMAGSGMWPGGWVRHHLEHNLWNKHNSVVFVGYAAQGTLARRIIDGGWWVRIFGEDIPVRADVHTIGGFSAHANRQSCWPGTRRRIIRRPLFSCMAKKPACTLSRKN